MERLYIGRTHPGLLFAEPVTQDCNICASMGVSRRTNSQSLRLLRRPRPRGGRLQRLASSHAWLAPARTTHAQDAHGKRPSSLVPHDCVGGKRPKPNSINKKEVIVPVPDKSGDMTTLCLSFVRALQVLPGLSFLAVFSVHGRPVPRQTVLHSERKGSSSGPETVSAQSQWAHTPALSSTGSLPVPALGGS